MNNPRLFIILMLAVLFQMGAAAQNDVCPSVRLDTRPRAKVQMNGKSVGNTPLVLKNLPHGEYIFTFSLPKYLTLEDTLVVDQNYPVSYMRELAPVPDGDTLAVHVTVMPTAPANVRREYIKKFGAYAEAQASYIADAGVAAGIAVGADLSHFNIEASYSYVFSRTQTFYWYSAGNPEYLPEEVTEYVPAVFGVRAGIKARVNNFMSLTPQAGFNYTALSSTSKKANGHGADCLSLTGGLRLFFACNPWLGVSVNPEYSFRVTESEAFTVISGRSDMLRNCCEGFTLSAGIVFFL